MADTMDKGAQVAAAMKAEGVSPDVTVQTDYFGFAERHKVTLPDGVSWIEHESLNEGGRRKYMNAVNRDVRLNRATGDVTLNMAAGDDRTILLKEAIKDWNLVRGGKPVPFRKPELDNFLDQADPTVIDFIEKDVRAKNPWLLNDVTEEDIDGQIEELEKRRQQIREREEGKVS